MYADLENALKRYGREADLRKAIRNARICIIDDQIDHLKSFVRGLNDEGFTNLVQKTHIESINELLENDYDLIVLDLQGVADGISADDGIGVIASLKESDPAMPILVVSGTNTSPDKSKIINQADLIRIKPVLPGDLASDIEDILKNRKSQYWGALAVLKELHKIKPEVTCPRIMYQLLLESCPSHLSCIAVAEP
ncbi:osmolarity response regulator [Anaerohalosphaera lusitana]|uniref:Osmolarity response regulator n=1 Tax=Anaerohalosphaera lusitana TaxID=1936003 RepID=A0A1U9NM83_9BACT|nr:response regulator [Anaerohalosphaera lusitana]AQT68844.1 osmolarity response regulator [Anaerohalosphaera lusitana]